MENDIEIIVPPKREFDYLELVLVRYEDDPEWDVQEYFDDRGYWQILAEGKLLAYGYGWDFGNKQLRYYSERMLAEGGDVYVQKEQKYYSESTKKLTELGAFGGPNAPTNKERWENRKK
jgi:hypothetical protein